MHKDKILELEDLDEFCNKSQIMVSNESVDSVFFVRISNKDKNTEFTEIGPGFIEVWERKVNSIYNLEIRKKLDLPGSVYNVFSGCSYKINKKSNLVDCGENLIPTTSITFNPIFIMEDRLGVFYSKDDTSMNSILNMHPNYIIVINRGDDSIYVKLNKDSPNNDESVIEIVPLVYVVFKRVSGEYSLKIEKKGANSSNKYMITSGNAYYYQNDANELYNDLTHSPVSKNYDNNQKHNIDIDPLSKWKRLRYLIQNFLNIKIIKDFSKLLFNEILIENKSGSDVYVRAEQRKIGSEQFYLVKSFQKLTWKRFDGKYLVEIVDKSLKSVRYRVDSGTLYYIDNDKSLKSALSGLKVEISEEMFKDRELVYYDEFTREYIRKQIDYNNKDSAKNIGKDTDTYEYFDGILPNYTPGRPYTDENFPPDNTSLRNIDPKNGKRRKPHFLHAETGLTEDIISMIGWKKPKDAFKGQYYLFKDEISLDDVKQGSIGDCYLMSVLAALSQTPQLIDQCFKSKKVNPDGFYEIFFHENGKKKVIFVDDNTITLNCSYLNQFLFALPNGEELWVMLLEKAYAKYEGGYSNIIGGTMVGELEWLTGAKTDTLGTNEPNSWNEISNNCKKGNIIVAASKQGSGNHFNSSEKGISNGHAYSILDAKEHRNSNKNLRLLKLRNPWGRVEWKGSFSDNSPLWTSELKKYFGFTDEKDDGIFFMPFDNFIEEFENVVICHLN